MENMTNIMLLTDLCKGSYDQMLGMKAAGNPGC